MTWLSIIIAGILTYFTRMTMIALIDRDMLEIKLKLFWNMFLQQYFLQ